MSAEVSLRAERDKLRESIGLLAARVEALEVERNALFAVADENVAEVARLRALLDEAVRRLEDADHHNRKVHGTMSHEAML